MSADVVVGLITLLGIAYLGWAQANVRRAEVRADEAEAIQHLTSALIQAIETLADRDQLIVELRARVESLEAEDRLKTARIAELERKISDLEAERERLLHEHEVHSLPLVSSPEK